MKKLKEFWGIIILVLLFLALTGCKYYETTPSTTPAEPATQPSEMPTPKPVAPIEPTDVPPSEMPTPTPVTPIELTKVEEIPSMSLNECLTQIKVANPEMHDQQAQDNCYMIEALNTNDKGLCDKVSEGFRPVCEQQFQ